jgi:hypothetical protein
MLIPFQSPVQVAGVMDCAEDENETANPIHLESSVSRAGLVDHSPSLREYHNLYHHHTRMCPAARIWVVYWKIKSELVRLALLALLQSSGSKPLQAILERVG